MELARVIPDCAQLFVELRRLLGDEWFREAETLSFEITEQGQVILHTGKGISFCYGVDASVGRILAIDRNQEPAEISMVEPDGSFQSLGPVELDKNSD